MRLLIVRNPDSPLLPHLLGAEGQKVVLIQSAVYDENLRQKGTALDTDALARGINAPAITASELVDEIFKAEKVFCI